MNRPGSTWKRLTDLKLTPRTQNSLGASRLRRFLTVALAIVALTAIGSANALASTPEQLFRKGTDSLAEGRFENAIDFFEAFADQGMSHPDASYNRGLAYLMRIRAGADRPGDLGRAAAAFQEALLLRSGDDAAEHALELVHAEVARRRARGGKDLVMVRPTLDRVIVNLASERTWGIAAVVASILLAIGLVMRDRKRGRIHLAGTLIAPTAILALLALLPLYYGARYLRQNTTTGVLVVREAYMTDKGGASQGGEPIPEATTLELGKRHGRYVHVRWGSAEGWIPASAVRVLNAP